MVGGDPIQPITEWKLTVGGKKGLDLKNCPLTSLHGLALYCDPTFNFLGMVLEGRVSGGDSESRDQREGGDILYG